MTHKKTTSDLYQLTGEIVDGFEFVSKKVMDSDQQRTINEEVYRVITEIRNIGDQLLPRKGFLFKSEIRRILGK